MPQEMSLKAFDALCDEVQVILLEEHKWFKRSHSVPDDAFLNKKRALLEKLKIAEKDLKDCLCEAKTDQTRRLAQAVQQKLMKIIMLDRENEQLLLACSSQLPVAHERLVSAEKLQKTYVAS